jgi:hypothetical protein
VGLVWAVQAGIRPSEGVFTLPFVLLIIFQQGRMQTFQFASVAISVVAVWYVPTAHHFGGGPLSPLRSASGQAGFLDEWSVDPHFRAEEGRQLNSPDMFGFQFVEYPRICSDIGSFYAKNTWMRSLAWLLAPGFAFYILILFASPAYLAYLVAPGLLLAGETLSRLPREALLSR